MKNFLCILSIVVGFTALSQTGPGGVGSSSSNNYWIDANSLSLSDGSGVTVFDDVSGNGNNFEQFSVPDQPTFTTGAVNGLPALDFDGSSDYMRSGSISAIESGELTWFVVYQKASNTSQGIIGGNYSSNPKQWLSYCNSGNNVVYNGHTSMGSLKNVSYNDGGSFTFASTHVTSSNIKTYQEGVLKGTKSATYTAPSGHNFVSLGHYPSITTSYFLNGYIAESFVFNTTLNDLERVIIENYLGAKYGFSIPQDFYSYQATHNIGVVGIGNDGSNTHVNSQGAGVLVIADPSAMGTGEYFFAGHTNVDLTTFETADMPVAISTHSRWSRTWRVDETGDVGSLTVAFDLSGGIGFGDPATYNLLVDNDGDFSDATIVAGVYNVGTQTMEFTVDLSSGDYITLSGLVLSPQAIHSVQSGSWYTASTWDCDCFPTLSDTVYVEPGHDVNIDGDAFVYDLFVENTGVLTMTQDFELAIYGDLSVNGSLSLSDGTIALRGNDAQNITANSSTVDLNNLIVENIGGGDVTFSNGEYVLNNTLFPLDGSMVVDGGAGGTFVVNSTSATTSGRIDRIYSGFTMTGNVTVKRFLAAGNADQRNICSPVIGATLAEWDNNLEISGEGFPDGCAYGPDGCYYSVKTNEHGEYSDVTDINTTLLPGEGYEIFVGTDLTTFDGATITSTGAIHAGEFTTPSYPYSWNIQGNPFASPILYSEVVRNGFTSNYFYVFDAASGGYQWYDGSSNTSSIPEFANGLLAIGQGFWTEGWGSITYPQTAKTSTQATFVRNSNIDESIYLTMKEQGTTYNCMINVDFNSEAFDNYDSLDIRHLSTGLEKASSLMINSNDGMLRKQYLYNDKRDKTLDLSISILNEGYFTIEASNIENANRYSSITLIDNLTGDVIDLKMHNSYTFYSEEGDSRRFQLVLSNEVIQTNETSIFESGLDDSELTITQMGNAIDVESDEAIEGVTEISIVNLLGQDVVYTETLTIEAGSNMVFVPSELSGMYLVVIKSANGVKTKKIML